jgi:hypothetical protein
MTEPAIDTEPPAAQPAFFCKRCGWSEDPANAWQVGSSAQAFHAPCPAPADDPGMA